jgi:sulfhydrogenase subunit beta (sulfur reductase)
MDKRIILFGVHACDIYSLNILDMVFAGRLPRSLLSGPPKEHRHHRDRLHPDEHCFCRSMRADFVDHGFDLFFYDIGDYYLTMVGTALGDDMVLATGPLFEQPAERTWTSTSAGRAASARLSSSMWRSATCPRSSRWSTTANIWDELGEKCLSCGNCSMVCPPATATTWPTARSWARAPGTRTRIWDSCLFSTHALVAGGENFRHRGQPHQVPLLSQAARLRGRVRRPSCVGCGRCIGACPVKIDIVEVLESRCEECNMPSTIEAPADAAACFRQPVPAARWRGSSASTAWWTTTTCSRCASSTRRWG